MTRPAGGPGIDQAATRVPMVMLVVTTPELPGYHLTAIYGLVVGVAGRPQNRFTEGIRSLEGEDVVAETFLAAGRAEAVERMVNHARARGANAVLSMRFDHRVVSDDWVEICAYGTAVAADLPGAVAQVSPASVTA